jgi:hypothetical protein
VRSAAPKKLSVYKTKQFGRFARKASISDADLLKLLTLVEKKGLEVIA